MFGDYWRFDRPGFRELDWVREMMDQLFPQGESMDIRSVPRGTFPMVNIGATDDAVRVYVFAPGVAANDLDVSIQDNVLILKGRRELPARQPGGEERTLATYRRERFAGEFSRAVALPEGLDGDAAEARFRNGVLEIRLPKREELQPRKIEISAA